MTTVSRFPRQNDVGLRALNVLWENLVLVVVLVLESKALYYVADGSAARELSNVSINTHTLHANFIPAKVQQKFSWLTTLFTDKFP